MAQTITVLIVDDHQMVRQGVRAFLEKQPDISVVGEAASGAEALRLAADLAPDVALMDLVMPEMDGVETTRRLKQASPRSQVIILTSYHDDEHIFPAIRAGALSYVLKDVSSGELIEIVRKAARGEAVMHPHVAARVMEELRGGPRAQTPFASALSERELETLRLIAEGLNNAEIAERLVISAATAKTHVARLFAKLNARDRVHLVIAAYDAGLVPRR